MTNKQTKGSRKQNQGDAKGQRIRIKQDTAHQHVSYIVLGIYFYTMSEEHVRNFITTIPASMVKRRVSILNSESVNE